MADTITTNKDLLDGVWPITDRELERLTKGIPDGLATKIHKAAWTHIKDDLAVRGLKETDLDDPTQFVGPAVFLVLHMLYQRSSMRPEDSAAKQAEFFYAKYERAYGRMKPKIRGGETTAEGSYGFDISRA